MPAPEDISLHPAAPAAEQVRRAYDAVPYPVVEPSAALETAWQIPAPGWLQCMGWPGRDLDRPGARILVAGCGTGREVFTLARFYSQTEVVGVDFSPRSIALAREFLPESRLPNVAAFHEGDLTDPSLPERLGGTFDFISCHGVLSNIPRPDAALATLFRCARPDAALYLGVNGAAHPSRHPRSSLPVLGFDPATLTERTEEFMDVLRAIDRLRAGALTSAEKEAVAAGQKHLSPLAEHSWSYLASDLLGACLHTLALGEWLDMARPAGWHFLACANKFHDLVRLVSDTELPDRIQRLDRPGLYEFVGALHPASFHRLILSASPHREPPWADPLALARWLPLIETWRPPAPEEIPLAPDGLLHFTVGVPALALEKNFVISPRMLAFLRLCHADRPLSETLAAAGYNEDIHPGLISVLRQLHCLCLLSFLPPKEN